MHNSSPEGFKITFILVILLVLAKYTGCRQKLEIGRILNRPDIRQIPDTEFDIRANTGYIEAGYQVPSLVTTYKFFNPTYMACLPNDTTA